MSFNSQDRCGNLTLLQYDSIISAAGVAKPALWNPPRPSSSEFKRARSSCE